MGKGKALGGWGSWVHGLTGLGGSLRATPRAVRGCLVHYDAAICCGRGGVPLPLLRAGRPHAGLKGRLCPFPTQAPAPIDVSWLLKRNGYS